MEYIISAFSDIGIKKRSNQDAIAVKAAQTPFGTVIMGIVCDGLGGLSSGELASSLVLRMYTAWFEKNLPGLMGRKDFENELRRQWVAIAKEADRRLGDYGLARNIRLGTTLTSMLIYMDKYYVIHVGDTRLYEITDGIRQITADHSYVAREVLMGRMTPEEAKTSSSKNVLLQCIGATQGFTPDFYSEDLKRNAVYVLCSDGFRNKIDDDYIFKALNPIAVSDKEQINSACFKLIDTIKQRNETDNISVGVVKIC